MSSGKKKTKEAKFTPASSVFQGIDQYNVDLGGLAGANVTRTPEKSIDMTSTLSPELSQSRDLATSGLNSNLSYINRTPTEQLQDLQAGNNSYYNLQAEINKRLADTALGQAQNRFSKTGLENSTVRGSFEGQLASDSMLQDLATRQASLEYLANQANQNIATQNQTLGSLASIQSIPLQMAQQNAMQGFGAVDQNSQFNAGQQNQISMFNAQQANQMAMQAAAQRSSLMGNLLGAGMSLAAIPLTGGMSSLGALSSLGSLGKAAAPSILSSPISLGNPFGSSSNPFLGQMF